MTTPPVMDGITSQTVQTDRITTRVLFSGPEDGTPVLFVHGNASSATFWEELMLSLPAGYRGIAPDQRGYGDADPDKKIDATRGMGDLADDLAALMDTLNLTTAHVVGHSLGGSVLWRFLADYANRVMTVTMAAPGSPYGFGGSKGLDGEPVYPDGAASGAAIVNQDFAKRIGENDTSNDEGSPRQVMNTFYWHGGFKPEREEALLQSLLSIHIGEQDYPGDMVPSENFPGAAPGKFGPNNALSPVNVAGPNKLYTLDNKPPILWIRGANDQIVSDNSMFDIGTLGKMGLVPGYPGEDVLPSQPMISQTRRVLEQYAEQGGHFEEIIFDDCGHSPYIEKLDDFNAHFHKHIGAK
jgi:pimeloyl-ACP methyl ester carboxylesterase